MRKERKVNLIRALKHELDFYKRQPVQYRVVDRTELNHFKLSSYFSIKDIIDVPDDVISVFLINNLVKEFRHLLKSKPIEIKMELDEDFGVYRASLDLWVKPKRQ